MFLNFLSVESFLNGRLDNMLFWNCCLLVLRLGLDIVAEVYLCCCLVPVVHVFALMNVILLCVSTRMY